MHKRLPSGENCLVWQEMQGRAHGDMNEYAGWTVLALGSHEFDDCRLDL